MGFINLWGFFLKRWPGRWVNEPDKRTENHVLCFVRDRFEVVIDWDMWVLVSTGFSSLLTFLIFGVSDPTVAFPVDRLTRIHQSRRLWSRFKSWSIYWLLPWCHLFDYSSTMNLVNINTENSKSTKLLWTKFWWF